MPNIIDSTARISSLADIEVSAKGSSLKIGAYSQLDSFVKIKFAGGTQDIIIGEHVYLNSGCVLYSGNGIRIGNYVLIAANCTFAPTNHEYKDDNIQIIHQRFKPSKGGIIIEDDVWIGANCVILDGTHIGKGCVIAALSLVKGTIPEYTIWGGNPLRCIGSRK